jgi:SAM-dependent methyltransferase/uncharacterized protein YbaR (Trm112 family)
MNFKFLSLLRCPYCSGSFTFKSARNRCGVLTCSCDKFPVVDGIPVIRHTPLGVHEHTTGDSQTENANHRQLVSLIEAGREIEALIRCLVFPIYLPRLARLVGWKGSQSSLFTRLRYSLCVPQVRLLLKKRDSVSALDLFRFFMRPDSPLGEGPRDYFIYRFGQPRHIAALALLEHLPADEKPILDVACGAGHMDHYLTCRKNPASVVGTDINFFQLWIAKHWIAPRGEYVCADLRDGLPFSDDGFSAAFCSDAYHYIPNRGLLMREITRCAPGKFTILTRVGNREVGPNEGIENDVNGYLTEIGEDARVFHEHDLMCDYLARTNPFHEQIDGRQTCSKRKWLSFAWNIPPALPEVCEWPHAIGVPALNPIYTVFKEKHGGQIKFRFPSAWYAFENAAQLEYQPRIVQLSRDELAELANPTSSLVARLVRQFVIVGMPPRAVTSVAEPGQDDALSETAFGKLHSMK